MPRHLLALIKRETISNPNSGDKEHRASLSLADIQGSDFGGPRYFTGYGEVGKRLQAEANVPYGVINDRKPLFDNGRPVRIWIAVEDEDIANLGFDPNMSKQEAAT